MIGGHFLGGRLEFDLFGRRVQGVVSLSRGNFAQAVTYLTHNFATLVGDHMATLFHQNWGRHVRIIVWDETVLTCMRRYNRGRQARSTWWAHGGVEIGRLGHIRKAQIFFDRGSGAERHFHSPLHCTPRCSWVANLDRRTERIPEIVGPGTRTWECEAQKNTL